ncbi:MAG: hypothetical protein WCH98_13640 [Verrucomicrobiota bacterium]
MKLSPLKNYRGANYPTRAILNRHPELLRVLPRRWRNSPVVLGTLAGLLAMMEQPTARAGDKSALHVAPIFEHGSGQGAFGCVAVSPPVFLTEAEAREVIEEESRKAGVEFSGRGHILNGVALPVTDEFAFLDRMDQKSGKKKAGKKSQTGDLELDGWNDRLQAGYEFVALSDFEAWESKDSGRMCTVSEYDMLDAAKRLQAGLGAAKQTGAVAVFYEPAGSAPKDLKYPASTEPKNGKPLTREETEARENAARQAGEEYWKNYQKAAKKAGEEDLRMQVRDYIAWLKAQGVI